MPWDPRGWLILATFGVAYYTAGRYEEAIAHNTRALLSNPRYAQSLRVLAASYAMLGQHDKAAEAMQRFRKVDPQATLSSLRVRLGFISTAVWTRLAEGLKLAGLPE